MPSRSSNSIMGKSISNNTVLRIILTLFFITLLLFFLIRMNKSTENFATQIAIPQQVKNAEAIKNNIVKNNNNKITQLTDILEKAKTAAADAASTAANASAATKTAATTAATKATTAVTNAQKNLDYANTLVSDSVKG